MRFFVNGKIYDSTEIPILIVFDDNEKEIFNGMNRFVSSPDSTTKGERQRLIELDIDKLK